MNTRNRIIIPAQVEREQEMTEEQAKRTCYENQRTMATANALNPALECPSGGEYGTVGAGAWEGYVGDITCSYHTPKYGYWEYWY